MNNNSPPEAKIALFRALFRGRDDVYPLRFESRKTGRSGYQPACANEWVKGLCDKRRAKCIECPNRRFLPVSDEVIRNHLSGQDDAGRNFIMGIYPMLLAYFSAASKTGSGMDIAVFIFQWYNHGYTLSRLLVRVQKLPFMHVMGE